MNRSLFDQMLGAMIEGKPGVSDLLFIPGRPPQIDCYGVLHPFIDDSWGAVVSTQATGQYAAIIMAENERMTENLRNEGSCDCSYTLPGVARFRVNIYRQNGHLALVMRKLSNTIPDLNKMGVPAVFSEVVKEHAGLIFVTGATGMGKTTTLAAILNELNRTQDIHIVTLEDPIEFLHSPIRASFSQREFGKDFFSYPIALKAALRQAPRAIFVGEIRDRETMEVAISAAETGHTVFTTLHTIDAGQTVNRILGMFSKDEEQLIRQRLADTLRWILAQRLVSQIGGGLRLITEIMGSNLRTREVIALGESEKRNLHEIIESSVMPWGWHSFEQSLLKAFIGGFITEETAILHATHKNKMRQALDQSKHTRTASSPMAHAV
jgi:twitching motility protein PilT